MFYMLCGANIPPDENKKCWPSSTVVDATTTTAGISAAAFVWIRKQNDVGSGTEIFLMETTSTTLFPDRHEGGNFEKQTAVVEMAFESVRHIQDFRRTRRENV